ncbi:MAG: hypothetical protein LBK82_12900 [Planctomycetaceae bacterium]|nr:hypothetical protein [Planctomycetaceae bacterium]
MKKRGGQSARWAVAPFEFYSTPKRKATPFTVVNLAHSAKRGGQSVRWTVAPVEFYSTPKRKAISFAVVNLVHCRLSPTQPFSERLPTFINCPPL